MPPSVAALARQVTAGTDNALDAGTALQEFFRSDFTYSTSVASGSDTAYLEHLAWEGAKQRWGDRLPDPVIERLAYELKVIADMGFSFSRSG